MILTVWPGPTRTGRIRAIVATLLANDYDAEPSECCRGTRSDDPSWPAGRADRGRSGCSDEAAADRSPIVLSSLVQAVSDPHVHSDVCASPKNDHGDRDTDQPLQEPAGLQTWSGF